MPARLHPHTLDGNEWRKVTARSAMPILAWCAQNRAEITYGGLDREIVRRGLGTKTHALAYKHPAEDIGLALEDLSDAWDTPVPLLNALIVNQGTGLPGGGVDKFLFRFVRPEDRGATLTKKERQIFVRRIIDLVHAYDRWPDVLAEFGLEPTMEPVLNVVSFADATPIALPPRDRIGRFGGSGGESEKHRCMKEYVAAHPHLIDFLGLDTFPAGETEHLLYSGDRIDVLFKTLINPRHPLGDGRRLVFSNGETTMHGPAALEPSRKGFRSNRKRA